MKFFKFINFIFQEYEKEYDDQIERVDIEEHGFTENDTKVEVLLDEMEDEFYDTPQSNQNTNVETQTRLNMPPVNSSINETPNLHKKFKERLTDINQAVKELKDLKNEINYENENEFDIFGKHVAAQLKKLPLEQALIAQDRIQSFLTQSRLQALRQNNVYSTPSSVSTEENNFDIIKLEPI